MRLGAQSSLECVCDAEHGVFVKVGGDDLPANWQPPHPPARNALPVNSTVVLTAVVAVVVPAVTAVSVVTTATRKIRAMARR